MRRVPRPQMRMSSLALLATCARSHDSSLEIVLISTPCGTLHCQLVRACALRPHPDRLIAHPDTLGGWDDGQAHRGRRVVRCIVDREGARERCACSELGAEAWCTGREPIALHGTEVPKFSIDASLPQPHVSSGYEDRRPQGGGESPAEPPRIQSSKRGAPIAPNPILGSRAFAPAADTA